MIGRAEALQQADELLLEIISSGDEKIFNAAMNDKNRIAVASMLAREKLADKIQAGLI